MMTEHEMQAFKTMFGKYCKDEIAKGHCVADTCETCPINAAYEKIFPANGENDTAQEKTHYRAVGIQWDTDGDDSIDLPAEIDIPDGMTDPDDISDYISDLTGFCHKGFALEEV